MLEDVGVYLDGKFIASYAINSSSLNEKPQEADYFAQAVENAIDDGLLEPRQRADAKCYLHVKSRR